MLKDELELWLSAFISTHSSMTIKAVVIPSDRRESRDLPAECLLSCSENAQIPPRGFALVGMTPLADCAAGRRVAAHTNSNEHGAANSNLSI